MQISPYTRGRWFHPSQIQSLVSVGLGDGCPVVRRGGATGGLRGLLGCVLPVELALAIIVNPTPRGLGSLALVGLCGL